MERRGAGRRKGAGGSAELVEGSQQKSDHDRWSEEKEGEAAFRKEDFFEKGDAEGIAQLHRFGFLMP